MVTDTLIEDDRWHSVDLPALAETAATAVLQHIGLAPERHEIAVLGCDDARIATLNADFRGKPQPTNVLSWPEVDLSAEAPGARPDVPREAGADAMVSLGDVAIAFDTCAREATAQGKSLSAHCTHLIIHAVLHLLGYDHLDDADAGLMEATETQILGKLGLPDPY